MPVVPDDEEEVVDPYVDDRSDSATNDGDDDDGEDDVPVMSDEKELTSRTFRRGPAQAIWSSSPKALGQRGQNRCE